MRSTVAQHPAQLGIMISVHQKQRHRMANDAEISCPRIGTIKIEARLGQRIGDAVVIIQFFTHERVAKVHKEIRLIV